MYTSIGMHDVSKIEAREIHQLERTGGFVRNIRFHNGEGYTELTVYADTKQKLEILGE